MLNIFNSRLIFVLVFSTALIMTLFGGVRLYLSEKAFEKNLDSLIEQTANRIRSVIKPSIWTLYNKSADRSFSKEFASGVLDSELTGEYIVGVVVYGKFGHIYMGKWKGKNGKIINYEQTQRQILLSNSNLLRSYPISFDTMTLGKVELFVDTKPFENHQFKTMVIELIQIGIVSLFFILILFYLIKRALYEPMHKLEIAHKAFESMTEAIVFTDYNGIIYESNNAFSLMTNAVSEEAPSKTIYTFFPDIAGNIEQLFENKNGGQLWKGEANFHYGKHQIIPTLLTISLANTNTSSISEHSELVFIFQNISEQKDAEKALQKLAFYDALTGQPNRQYFEEELAVNLRLAHRKNNKVFLIFIDLDNFKHINDALGHDAGDQVLIKVTNRFKMRLRETDFLSRIGGDEFTVIINDITDSEKAAELAKSLIRIVSEPIIINNSEFRVGASLGIAIYPDDASNAQDLVKSADIAMYNAKDLGKNQLSFFSNDLNDKAEKYFELKNNIDLAVINNEFRLYYQPKVDLSDNTLKAAEGLIRWIKPNGEMVLPDKFISVAEETRQIIPIGKWVIETAVKQLKQWQGTKFSELSLSINVSPIQLYNDDFIAHLKETLLKYAVNPVQLEVEITENAIITDVGKAVLILNELKKLGVKLSLDDFGTGYSSLSYLQILPVDILKIDRSFISSATAENASGKILVSIINLAQDLEIDVVAEGIEDKEHLELLKTYNCHFGQGYLFSRPLPIEDFEKFEVTL